MITTAFSVILRATRERLLLTVTPPGWYYVLGIWMKIDFAGAGIDIGTSRLSHYTTGASLKILWICSPFISARYRDRRLIQAACITTADLGMRKLIPGAVRKLGLIVSHTTFVWLWLSHYIQHFWRNKTYFKDEKSHRPIKSESIQTYWDSS